MWNVFSLFNMSLTPCCFVFFTSEEENPNPPLGDKWEDNSKKDHLGLHYALQKQDNSCPNTTEIFCLLWDHIIKILNYSLYRMLIMGFQASVGYWWGRNIHLKKTIGAFQLHDAHAGPSKRAVDNEFLWLWVNRSGGAPHPLSAHADSSKEQY